jgi:hypothetical protein
MRAVCGLEGEQAESKRDHDQREMAEARNHETHGKADEPGDRRRNDQSGQRFAPAKF